MLKKMISRPNKRCRILGLKGLAYLGTSSLINKSQGRKECTQPVRHIRDIKAHNLHIKH